MINNPVNQWEEKDLQELIERNLGESIFREYKEQINISSKGEKKEICKDVSAIANSYGGQIIFGIEEVKERNSGSIPKKLKPIKDFSQKEIMQQILADGILPRVEFQIFSIKIV